MHDSFRDYIKLLPLKKKRFTRNFFISNRYHSNILTIKCTLVLYNFLTYPDINSVNSNLRSNDSRPKSIRDRAAHQKLFCTDFPQGEKNSTTVQVFISDRGLLNIDFSQLLHSIYYIKRLYYIRIRSSTPRAGPVVRRDVTTLNTVANLSNLRSIFIA